MKKLVVAMMCLMMCFSTVMPVQVHACSDLVSSMFPSSPSSYPTCTDWEPSFLGHRIGSKKAKKTYVHETAWKTLHTEYLYKTSKKGSKKGSKTTYTKYKRTHICKYRTYYTKGSKKYAKDEMSKVTLAKVGTSKKKPSSPYKKW